MRRVLASWTTAILFAGALAPGPALAQSRHDVEAQVGAQVYNQLRQKGEIISRASDPRGYALLDPIAARIARVADPQYDFPFHFILVNEKQPNAFAVPGGNVYVTNSLLRFVQNTEELAGVLCHETSHDIHHDVVNNAQKDQRTGTIIGILGAITGLSNSGFGQLGENLAYTLQSNNYSRAVESAADHKGALTCAQAGYNPWGLVWLFKNYEKADTGGSMEMLSDHPTDSHRITDLETQFRDNPQIFGRFSSNIASATPLGSSATAYKPPRSRATHATRTTRSSSSSHYCCAPRTTSAASNAHAQPPSSADNTTTIIGH